jgi:adenylate cyclase
VLLTPAREVLVHGVLWALAAVVFTIINRAYSHDLALIVAITVALAGAATCAVAYLLAQRVLRPVAARALADAVPEKPALPGITTRILLTYVLGTGVPVLGITLVGAGVLSGVVDASSHRLATTALLLGSIALVVGLAVMALTARSLADPLEGLRGALRRVQRGDEDAQVDVYDGSEVGLLQAGFNAMVDGLRERERLRDLFGRQVGEDVAREALERGITLGGEERDVAVLFIDLVGSTELAHDRPPGEVVELLNEFFCVVVDVVDGEGGSVNKFVGDAALCVFGAPLPHDDAAGAALRAARALRDRLAEEVPQCDVGIGVSAGTAVAGNIGAQQRYEYTVIGDPVNEASRLTELAKRHDGRVLASEAVLERAADGEGGRWELGGEETLRGRSAPTRLAAPRSAR